MPDANVKLSPSELELVCNAEIILTKNRIIEKVYALFGIMAARFQQINVAAQTQLPEEIFIPSPKIYRGEQYLQLPYVMLDCPRYFKGPDAFAIRCMFWWGNFFSIALQLSGSCKEKFADRILHALKKNEGWYICINAEAWQHHFEKDNYVLFDEQNFSSSQFSFLKIAKKISLSDWEHAEDFYANTYHKIIRMLTQTES